MNATRACVPRNIRLPPLEERLAAGNALVEEDRPQLGQRSRVLGQERVGDRRDEVVERAVALEGEAVAVRRRTPGTAREVPPGPRPRSGHQVGSGAGLGRRRGGADGVQVAARVGPRVGRSRRRLAEPGAASRRIKVAPSRHPGRGSRDDGAARRVAVARRTPQLYRSSGEASSGPSPMRAAVIGPSRAAGTVGYPRLRLDCCRECRSRLGTGRSKPGSGSLCQGRNRDASKTANRRYTVQPSLACRTNVRIGAATRIDHVRPAGA